MGMNPFAVKKEAVEETVPIAVMPTPVNTGLLQDLEVAIDAEDSPQAMQKITDSDVDYYIRQVKLCQQHIDDAKAAADAYIEKKTQQVNKWFESSVSSDKFRMEQIKAALEEYAADKLKDSKKKSLKFIEGTLSFKKVPDTYKHDDDILRDYLLFAGPKYLEEQPMKVLWSELKKAGSINQDGKFTLDGTVLEGVTVTKNPPSFTIK